MKTLLLTVILMFVLSSCDCGEKNATTKKTAINTTTIDPGTTLKTVSHDGHKFIMLCEGFGEKAVNIIHHPGCKCNEPGN